MGRSTIIAARQLANYINDNTDLLLVNPKDCPYRDHVGALFTDIILQSAVNYRNVVVPRVNHVLKAYPKANSVNRFSYVIEKYGAGKVLNWKDSVKLNRMLNLLQFCLDNNLNVSGEIKDYLFFSENQKEFLKIHGIGNKTLDYLRKLLNFDSIAVDRHIFSFVHNAGIESKDYDYIKTLVEYTADIMDVSRRTIDYSIWLYMSSNIKGKQLSIDFQ